MYNFRDPTMLCTDFMERILVEKLRAFNLVKKFSRIFKHSSPILQEPVTCLYLSHDHSYPSFPFFSFITNFNIIFSFMLRNWNRSLSFICWPCISVFNQLHAQNVCFTISFISCLYMFRTHVLIIRRLCNATLTPWWWAHVLETCIDMK